MRMTVSVIDMSQMTDLCDSIFDGARHTALKPPVAVRPASAKSCEICHVPCGLSLNLCLSLWLCAVAGLTRCVTGDSDTDRRRVA